MNMTIKTEEENDMHVRKWMSFALCAVLLAGLLAGCGGASKSEGMMMNAMAPMEAAGSADYAVAETMAASEAIIRTFTCFFR